MARALQRNGGNADSADSADSADGADGADGVAARVVAWQRQHGRHHLPWQGTQDPYRVWLSEVMLQQTQVSTVLSYYARFLQRFPDVAALAAASLDDVLALWSGLGYYSRARNLHRCAQAVVVMHGGQFPRTAAALATLPGIGQSTAAAIAAFCFAERVAILDGNVKRVLTRLVGFDADLARAANVATLWRHAQDLVPAQHAAAYTQGLMDIGATLCSVRQPECARCPLESQCAAHAAGTPERFPVKTRTLKRSRRSNAWLWLQHGHRLWLVQRPATGVWAGLWSLAEFDSLEDAQSWVGSWPGQGEVLASFRHTLTHFDWTLQPLRWRLPALGQRAADSAAAGLAAQGPGRWVSLDEALLLGLPAPLRKLLLAQGKR